MLTLKRTSSYTDSLRNYKVILDGNEVGEISNGGEFSIDIPEGTHELFLKIDWCTSNKVNFETKAAESVEFECGSNITGWKTMVIVFFVLFASNEYIWLKKK